MINNISIKSMLNAIVPISRFNKGEASKIFDEVNLTGAKIVVKNNKPACVLITPEKYEDMMEAIENYKMIIESDFSSLEKASQTSMSFWDNDIDDKVWNDV